MSIPAYCTSDRGNKRGNSLTYKSGDGLNNGSGATMWPSPLRQILGFSLRAQGTVFFVGS